MGLVIRLLSGFRVYVENKYTDFNHNLEKLNEI